MGNRDGKIIIGPGLNVWPHELRTAEALARAGHTVEFVRKSEVDHQRTPDVLIDGVPFEMKAPKSGRIDMIHKNVRRALRQANCVVFDSRRMKVLPDRAIERELRARAEEARSLRRLLYINRHGKVVNIK